MLRLCAVCKKNETGRLMDGGWGEKLPVCTECLTSGRWRELLPPKPEPEKVAEMVVKQKPEVIPIGMFWCSHCKSLHRENSKTGQRHLKYQEEG